MAQQKRYIRASEIGTYIYCQRSWWLQHVHGEKSRNVRELTSGTAYHDEHARSVNFAQTVRSIAYALLALSIIILMYWVLSSG